MVFSYLTTDNVFRRYTTAKKYTDQLTTPFSEFERIAGNRAAEGIDPAYPRTTDGTTASIIRKTPRRIIQQLPTGRVESDEEDWLSVVADFILTHKLLPYANEEYDLIQKCWTAVERGLTFGFCATYTPFLNHDGEFGTDVSPIYWGDIMLQPGKKSGYSCNYVFMRSWWQKEDIDALIDRESKTTKKAKKRGDEYQSTWDVKALKTIRDNQKTKDQQATTPVEKERGTVSTAIELITAFQKGVGANFYTFELGSETIVRTETNKDPRGKMPIDWLYGDIDGTNPLGRGIVELVGGLQNLIDSDMQMYQYNRALMLAPPLVVQNINKNKVKFVPNAIIDAGTNPNAKVTPLDIDTSAVINYPALYGLQKSQLLNLVNSPDTSISSDVGNPNFSKTTAGVQQQAATISVDDNYVRKMFEAWFEHWCETAINLYFAKRSGIEELQLDKDTAMRLRELEGFDETLLTPDNLIRIDYDTETPALKFHVDPSTTSVKDAAAQVQDAQGLLDMVMKYPMLNASYGGAIDTDVLARRIVVNSGIDDPEQVAPEPTAAQKQSKEEQKNTVSPFSPMFDKPSIRMNFPDLPPAAQVQVLANAGIQVSLDDILAGPVADPNVRGVFNPFTDPNSLLPGSAQSAQGPDGQPVIQPTQPAVQSTAGQAPGAVGQPAGANPLQQDGINLTPQEIQRLQQDPRFAQAQQGPSQPSAAQPQQPQQVANPLDAQVAQQLQGMGFNQDQIGQAIAMLDAGYSHADVMKMLAATGHPQLQGIAHG